MPTENKYCAKNASSKATFQMQSDDKPAMSNTFCTMLRAFTARPQRYIHIIINIKQSLCVCNAVLGIASREIGISARENAGCKFISRSKCLKILYIIIISERRCRARGGKVSQKRMRRFASGIIYSSSSSEYSAVANYDSLHMHFMNYIS